MSSFTRQLWVVNVTEALATPISRRTEQQQEAVEFVWSRPTARETASTGAVSSVSLTSTHNPAGA